MRPAFVYHTTRGWTELVAGMMQVLAKTVYGMANEVAPVEVWSSGLVELSCGASWID